MIELANQAVGVGVKRGLCKLINGTRKRITIHLLFFNGAENFGVLRWANLHPFFPKILAQFFAGANTRERDLNIAMRL